MRCSPDHKNKSKNSGIKSWNFEKLVLLLEDYKVKITRKKPKFKREN